MAPSRAPSRRLRAESVCYDKDSADLSADPAGVLCDNIRELTAHLRGVYHSLSREDQTSVALRDSMRELTAQLKGITANLKDEGKGAKQRHPLARRKLDDGPLKPKDRGSCDGPLKPKASSTTAPGGTTSKVLSKAPQPERATGFGESRPLSRSCGRRTRPRPRSLASPRDQSAAGRKRAASRESGSERLKRLGLVGIPKAEKMEAADCAETERMKPRAAQATERMKPRAAQDGGNTKQIQKSDSMAAMDEDVRRMLEWAAAEAAHTRRVASRASNFSEGPAHYSVARVRYETKGRLANRLRAATLNRARQARQAMQSKFLDGPEGLRHQPGMVEPRREAFPHVEAESLDEEVSQDEDGASFLTSADRQRIGEVLAEQELRRRGFRPEARPRPRTVETMWPSPGRREMPPWPEGSYSPDRSHRPPSRGGESWQPLGQTTPPAYEQVTPELLQLWQIQEMQLQATEQPAEDSREEFPELPAEPSRGPEVHGDGDQEGHEIPDAIDPMDVAERTEEVELHDTDRPREEEIQDVESEVYSEGIEAPSDGGEDGEDPAPPGTSDVGSEVYSEGVEAPSDGGDGKEAKEAKEAPAVSDIESEISEGIEAPSDGGDDEEELAPLPVETVEPAEHQFKVPAPEEIEVASVHSSEDLGLEDIEVTEGQGFQADEWILEVPSKAEVAQSTEPAPEAAPTVQEITEEVISVIMEELINDTIQSSTQAAEPALWHPTPVAPPFIDIFNEDAPDGGLSESEPLGPSPRRPVPQNATSSKPLVEGEELSDAGRQSKDSGPPRPPSPPPDVRSLATTSPTFQAPAQASPRPKGKQEQADLISQDLLEMLLGEALQEFEGACNFTSSVEEERVTIGSSGPSPLIQGPKPIDTSEAVVGPFVEAAFQYFGVVDETQPVASPLPPVEEWLPSVKELMRKPEEPEESETPEDSDTASAIEGFTRLLADALLEIASEEIKEQGAPRNLGWRRPCFGEAPLARFREKQAQEGQSSSQKQTWEKVRTKLTEQVRFGWRSEANAEESSAVQGIGRMTIDLEAGAAGALALANLDEGIDALLEEEICSDEASWLDIKADVQRVKNEVARMIFGDLVEELANEIGTWPVV